MPTIFYYIAIVIIVFCIVIYRAKTSNEINIKKVCIIGLISLIVSFILFQNIGAGWLNLGSLAFGLIAWILPVYNLVRRNMADNRYWAVFSVASISACAISLHMQISYSNYLVNKNDWSALMDTSNVLTWVSALLLITTIILNVISLVVYHDY